MVTKREKAEMKMINIKDTSDRFVNAQWQVGAEFSTKIRFSLSRHNSEIHNCYANTLD